MSHRVEGNQLVGDLLDGVFFLLVIEDAAVGPNQVDTATLFHWDKGLDGERVAGGWCCGSCSCCSG